MIGWIKFISWLVVISGILTLGLSALRYSRLADIRRRVARRLLSEVHVRRSGSSNPETLDAELDQLEQEEGA